jgi:uncharacterized protein
MRLIIVFMPSGMPGDTQMKKTKDVMILPFNSARLGKKRLVTNFLGAWDILDQDQFKALNSLRLPKDSPLFIRLKERGLVVDPSNVEAVLKDFRNTNAHLFQDTSLHIAVVTTRCNQRCSYCQTKSSAPEDMTIEVAAKVLQTMFEVRSPSIMLEFQGGEPLLNWPVVKFMVENVRKVNIPGKNIRISMVSNLALLDDVKMKFLAQHDVAVCSSLDGTKKIHDQNRKRADGEGTYQEVIAKIKRFKSKFGRSVDLLPTITKDSLQDPKGLIDEYVRLGQREIALRPVNNMGSAACCWKDLGYTPEAFVSFYKKALNYILELNAKGIMIRERTATVILTKVLAKRDPGFVDLMNPCGAGRAVMAYMPDGSCYPCDEARMLSEDIFKLGNILHEKRDEMMKKDNFIELLKASCSDLWNYASVYSPWIGVCPVVNYALQKNVVPRIACSPMNKILTAQFECIFEKIAGGGRSLKIFNTWVKGDSYGKE